MLTKYRLLCLGLAILIVMQCAAWERAMGSESALLNGPGGRVAFYNAPASDAALLGSYQNGLDVQILRVEAGWTFVGLTVYEAQMTIEGYVRTEELTDSVLYKDPSLTFPVLEVTEEAGWIDVLETREPQGRSFGRFSAGTRFIQLGDLGDWYLVNFGQTSGFVPAQSVRRADCEAGFYSGIPAIGYGQTNRSVGSVYLERQIYAGPSLDSQWLTWLYGNTQLEVLAELEGWCQVRGQWIGNGFIQAEYLSVYRLDELFVEPSLSFGIGSYVVGRDLPPGLYEYVLQAGQSGSIEVIGESVAAYKYFESNGAASFSMYLAENMIVDLRSGGVLRALVEQSWANPAEWRIQGTGRLMVGPQIPHTSEISSYAISLLPGESVGYYAIFTLEQEEGKAARPDRWRLVNDDDQGERFINLQKGEFFEFRNCVIRAERGNG